MYRKINLKEATFLLNYLKKQSNHKVVLIFDYEKNIFRYIEAEKEKEALFNGIKVLDEEQVNYYFKQLQEQSKQQLRYVLLNEINKKATLVSLYHKDIVELNTYLTSSNDDVNIIIQARNKKTNRYLNYFLNKYKLNTELIQLIYLLDVSKSTKHDFVTMEVN